MNKDVLAFLRINRVAVLTTMLQNNMPHAAALHYSIVENPEDTSNFKLLFSVDSEQRKVELLNTTESCNGALVIGFSEEEWVTLQIEGVVRILNKPDDIQAAQQVHYKKHPNSEKYKDFPTTMFIEFVPTWWRYTDFNTDEPTIYSSELQ